MFGSLRNLALSVYDAVVFCWLCLFGGGLTAAIRRATRFCAGPNGFGSATGAKEVCQRYKARINGTVAVVTGPTIGSIGYNTCLELARAGATVVLGGRSRARLDAALAAIKAEVPNAKLDSVIIDLESLASVRTAAAQLKKQYPAINMLINNAGIMGWAHEVTQDGAERTFTTDHLGPFLLTELLIDNVRAAAAAARNDPTAIGGRVVNVASTAQFGIRKLQKATLFDLSTINDKTAHKEMGAYARAKFANVLHARALAVREQKLKSGVVAVSLMPGVIASNLSNHMLLAAMPSNVLERLKQVLFALPVPYSKRLDQGAATTVFCATAPADLEFDAVADVVTAHKQGKFSRGAATSKLVRSGSYYDDCTGSAWVHPWATDVDVIRRMWRLSATMCKVGEDSRFLDELPC